MLALALVSASGAWLLWQRASRALVEAPQADLAHAEPGVIRRIREATQAVERDPDSEEAWGRLGTVFEVHGFYAEAVACYERAGELDGDDFRWPYFLGICRRTDNLEAAAGLLGRAARLKPDHVPVQIALGEVELKLGRLEKAAARFQRAAELDARCAKAWAGLGSVALSRGNLDAARRHLTRALRLAPHFSDAHRLLSQVHRRRGEVEAAEREARLASRKGSEPAVPDRVRDTLWWREGASFKWRAKRAARHRTAGRWDQAVHEWEQAVRDDPESALAHAELAVDLARCGRQEEARWHHERAKTLGLRSGQVCLALGIYLAGQGRTEEAILSLEEALRLDPGLSEARANLGSLLAQRGRLEEGLVHLRAATEAMPANVNVRYNLGLALRQGGHFRQAVQVLRDVIRSQPAHPSAHDQLGKALAALGRYGEAIAACRSGLAQTPGNVATANRLAWLLATCPDGRWRDGQKALALARRLCRMDGFRSPDLLATLAAARAETGDLASAVKVATRAVELASQAASAGRLPHERVQTLQVHLACYRAGSPFRDTAPGGH